MLLHYRIGHRASTASQVLRGFYNILAMLIKTILGAKVKITVKDKGEGFSLHGQSQGLDL